MVPFPVKKCLREKACCSIIGMRKSVILQVIRFRGRSGLEDPTLYFYSVLLPYLCFDGLNVKYTNEFLIQDRDPTQDRVQDHTQDQSLDLTHIPIPSQSHHSAKRLQRMEQWLRTTLAHTSRTSQQRVTSVLRRSISRMQPMTSTSVCR